MSAFTKTTIRLAIDVSTPRSGAVDYYTALPPAIWRGADLRVEVAFFNGRDPDGVARILDVSNVQQVTMGILASTRTGDAYLSKTVLAADMDNAATVETWNDGTKQHVAFDLTSAETPLPIADGATSADFFLVFSGSTTDDTSGRDIFGWADLTVLRSGVEDGYPGQLQAGTLIPQGAEYDSGTGEYELTGLTAGAYYDYVIGVNDTDLFNDPETLTASGSFVAVGTSVVLSGTAGEPVTAVVRRQHYPNQEDLDGRYLRKGGDTMTGDLTFASTKGISGAVQLGAELRINAGGHLEQKADDGTWHRLRLLSVGGNYVQAVEQTAS